MEFLLLSGEPNPRRQTGADTPFVRRVFWLAAAGMSNPADCHFAAARHSATPSPQPKEKAAVGHLFFALSRELKPVPAN